MEKIKEVCPFCGGDMKIVNIGFEEEDYYMAQCEKCHISVCFLDTVTKEQFMRRLSVRASETENSSDSEVKACPFCGSHNVSVEVMEDGEEESYAVKCENYRCNAVSILSKEVVEDGDRYWVDASREETIEAYNRRK